MKGSLVVIVTVWSLKKKVLFYFCVCFFTDGNLIASMFDHRLYVTVLILEAFSGYVFT